MVAATPHFAQPHGFVERRHDYASLMARGECIPPGYGLLLMNVACWGAATVVVGVIGRKDGGSQNGLAITVLAQLTGMLPGNLAFPVLLAGGWREFVRHRPRHVRWAPLVVAAAPLTTVGAFTSYFLAIGGGLTVALVQVVSVLSVAVPAAYGVLLWGEAMPPKKAAAILGIMVGCVLVSLGGKQEAADDDGGQQSGGGVSAASIVALVSMVACWGACFCVMSYGTRHLRSIHAAFWCMLAGTVALVLAALAAVLVEHSGGEHGAFAIDWGEFAMMFISQILNVSGNFCYVKLTLDHEAAGSMVAPLTQLYNAIPVIFAAIMYGEAITPWSGTGVAVSVACAVGLSLADKLVHDDEEREKQQQQQEEEERSSDVVVAVGACG